MHIEKDVSDVFVHGTTNLATVNTPSQVYSGNVKPMKGIQLKAGIDNGGVVFIGNKGCNHLVTNAACGMPLDAGESLFLPVEDATWVYANNLSANDVVHYVIL